MTCYLATGHGLVAVTDDGVTLAEVPQVPKLCICGDVRPVGSRRCGGTNCLYVLGLKLTESVSRSWARRTWLKRIGRYRVRGMLTLEASL